MWVCRRATTRRTSGWPDAERAAGLLETGGPFVVHWIGGPTSDSARTPCSRALELPKSDTMSASRGQTTRSAVSLPMPCRTLAGPMDTGTDTLTDSRPPGTTGPTSEHPRWGGTLPHSHQPRVASRLAGASPIFLSLFRMCPGNWCIRVINAHHWGGTWFTLENCGLSQHVSPLASFLHRLLRLNE
jgi:hypothetical protein